MIHLFLLIRAFFDFVQAFISALFLLFMILSFFSAAMLLQYPNRFSEIT